MLAAEFFENAGNIRSARSEGHIVSVWTEFMEVLQMAAHDAALKNFQCVNWFNAGARKMSGIRAGADSAVAILDEGVNVIRVPVFVFWIIWLLGVIVNSHGDVVFLHQFLDQ